MENLQQSSKDTPTIYDQYCVVGSAHPSNDKLINYNQGSSTLADKLTSENIYYDGHISYLVNNNSSAKLYAPPVWAPGSSIAHLDGDVYTANNRNSLMTHERDMAEVVHSPGELGLSILADIGWSVNRLMIINFPTVETTLTKGSTINIKWAENQGGYVDLVLYRIVSGIPQYETTINSGSVYSNRGENNYLWTIPSSPTEVPVGQYRIKLEFGGEGLSVSEVFNISDQLQVATPDITPKSGTYTTTQSVTITCSTANAQIYYTTNGTVPSTSSTLYNGLPFNATPPVTIKAKAFFETGFIPSETATEVYMSYPDGVKVSQLDKNGISFGRVGFWTYSNYWNLFNSGTVMMRYSPMIVKALQDYKSGSTEKFNFWIDNQNRTFFRNWESINTSSSTKEIKAQFEQAINVTLQNTLEGFTSFNNDTISFKDPWKKDDFSDQNKGVRNRGSSALMNPYNSPLSITTSGDFMGVLKNQEIEDGTYYSAQAQSTQQINGTNAFFANWTATGADVPSPNSLETPIVFRQADAVVKANYKGTHLSGNPSAIANNSQNKFIKADDKMYQVYESMSRIWLERSTNNGSSWEILNNAQPIDAANGKYPSLAHFDSGNQSVNVVYLDDAYGYQIRVKVFQSGSPDFEAVAGDFDNDLSVSSISQPVAAYNYNGRIIIVWNHAGYLYYRFGQIIQSENTIYWYNSSPTLVTGSGPSSTRPTLSKDNGLDFYLAWQEGWSNIKYCKLGISGGGGNIVTITDQATISTGGGYPTNYYPNITTTSSGYPTVVWVTAQYYGSSMTSIIRRIKTSSGWSSTFSWYGSQASYPQINMAGSAYVVAWTENSGAVKFVKPWGGVISFGTSGRYIQLANAPDLNSMYGSILSTTSSPYPFTTTTSVGTTYKVSAASFNQGRGVVAREDTTQFFFVMGDVSLNGGNIGFVELPDTLIIKKKKELEDYLLTEAFQFSNSDELMLSLYLGVSDSIAANSIIGKNINVNFSFELIEDGTNKVLGKYENFVHKKDAIINNETKSYKINGKGIGNKLVRLKMVLNTNIDGEFTLLDVRDNQKVLAKTNGNDVESISYAGDLEIKDYALSQNYPNPRLRYS